ncbi:segregation/condensation protein A [Aureibacillus halotolerans]|uniref:Segregation and condensation protein A n=1 Tax=Aureibacillus halotolerans TaxID=1508390 RepID=A0A4R6U9D1_9BACI|nr:segregation/condensation protein A [Aureibacillus halotolerans]TDQ41583.1 condensin subunit ScpA [Aureibacillus halotolerans]
MSYQVKLESFEGPLDLLLHLTQRFEIDIYNIPVREITDQYMAYIHAMKTIELNVASEYLVMAATLLELKSKMLLPQVQDDAFDDWDEEEEEDPTAMLMEKLVLYKRYKEAASRLRECEAEHSRLFSRPCHSLPVPKAANEEVLQNVSLYDLAESLLKLQQKTREQGEPARPDTVIQRQDIPIEHKMTSIVQRLQRKRLSFAELMDSGDRTQVVVTFLAVLELLKTKKIGYRQGGNFSEIELYLEHDVETRGMIDE